MHPQAGYAQEREMQQRELEWMETGGSGAKQNAPAVGEGSTEGRQEMAYGYGCLGAKRPGTLHLAAPVLSHAIGSRWMMSSKAVSSLKRRQW